jgi:PemK-like, MazF-like toxin of type II toxin-antitoxin system
VTLQPGAIIWVLTTDRYGVNEKVRPAVVIACSSDASSGDQVVAAAITTTIPNPLSSNLVELPWNRQGTAKTKLRRRSAVVCDWLLLFESSCIQSYSGYVPGNLLTLIMLKIEELKARFDE